MSSLSQGQIQQILNILTQGGQKALTIWRQQEDIDAQKKADGTPVTQADRLLSSFYIEQLPKVLNVPVVSEEEELPSEPNKTYFIVDPIDGTKYFSNKEPDWVTMVALIHDCRPVFGMILHPASGDFCWAQQGEGAHCQTGAIQPIQHPNPPYIAFSSGFHKKPVGQKIKESFQLGKILERGSALKFMNIATGEAHFYPRKGPTGEWDTAAGQILLEESNGFVLDLNTGEPMLYGKPDFKNRGFIAGHNVLLNKAKELLQQKSSILL